ncbi:toll-like receptor Tollo [Palaemon carinicauda]|uniref:toll-like receptor Tollo n=1 Tax=Palaemon carinicauda TaxID=392227 RepID=UPI0035B66CD3
MKRNLWCLSLAALLWAAASAVNVGPPDYHSPDDCQVTSLEGTDLVALLCRLRRINSELDTTNFSNIPPRNTARLKIECSDVLFFQSALQNKSFVKLRELQELDIEYCKIGEVPREAFLGLTNLKNLTLRTYNTDWSAMALKIASEAFKDQRNLERLDLGDNNIWTLPPVLLCDLENLKMLSLSRNKLQDITVLSFSQAEAICAPSLRFLDLSFNHLVHVPAYAFAALKVLQTLNMSLNGISNLEDKALFGMYSLEVLDLSGNLLTALPPELFQENKRLTKLYIRNNSVSVLAPGLFSGLSLLLELELSDNKLKNTWVNSETFTDLLRLASLDLSNNLITRLDAATFRNLTNLQVLKLQQNMIDSISDNTFRGLFRLHTLILTDNRLKVINDKAFRGLIELRVLRLDNNEVFSIDSNALQNSTGLQELQISQNHLQDVPILLKSLTTLKTLDLSGNHVSVLSNNSFVGLHNVSVLKLAANEIDNITKNVFVNLPSLQVLDLARNNIHSIENGAFENNKLLEAVRLDDNVLASVKGLFSSLQNLQWLNLSKNHLTMFDYDFIPRGLKYLDLRENYISELGNHYEIESQLHLKIIDASNNRLTDISSSSVPDSVEILFLNNNQIHRVQPYAFFKKKNLTRVDLYGNRIKNIEQNALRISTDTSRDLPIFYLGKNPFECDCKMQWLQNINSIVETRQHPTVGDLDEINCKLMNKKGVVRLLEAEKLQFLCEYDSHCFSVCHCCDFDACDCEMTCPSNCTCFHDESWAANIVDCSSAGYDLVPERIPMDSSEVYLDGNDLEALSSHTFIGRKNMKVLYINDSKVEVIHNRTFNGLKLLEVLYLHDNLIRELKGFEFEHLAHLRELHLQNNQLVSVHNTTFLSLVSLTVLRIDGNKLKVFPVNMLRNNHLLHTLHLGNNPWTCDCADLGKIQTWISGVAVALRDTEKVTCALNGSAEVVAQVSSFNYSSCNNETEMTTTIRHEAYLDYVFLPTITLGAFAVLLTITLVIFCNRNRMRVWVYAKYGVRLFYRSEYEGDTDKAFDAFVSYSSKDEVFVTQILAPELERGSPAYKLCLHYRDFPVGAFITDTILSAVETSKRTILILSENFIKSEWCRFEFRSAHHEVLKDRRRRLIVILLGDVPQRDLDPDIRLYLKTNTYLKWGDTHFWEKLKFAMPDAQPPTRNHQLHALASQQQQQQQVQQTSQLQQTPQLQQTGVPRAVPLHM